MGGGCWERCIVCSAGDISVRIGVEALRGIDEMGAAAAAAAASGVTEIGEARAVVGPCLSLLSMVFVIRHS